MKTKLFNINVYINVYIPGFYLAKWNFCLHFLYDALGLPVP